MHLILTSRVVVTNIQHTTYNNIHRDEHTYSYIQKDTSENMIVSNLASDSKLQSNYKESKIQNIETELSPVAE